MLNTKSPLVVSPPISVMPKRCASEKKLSQNRVSHFSSKSDNPALSRTHFGTAPIAAISDMLTASIFHAKSSGETSEKKCLSLINISELKHKSNPILGRMMAASSPIPNTKPSACCFCKNCLIKSNSVIFSVKNCQLVYITGNCPARHLFYK